MIWHARTWAALTRDELYAILALRQQVFVVEQRRPCLDVDGHDGRAQHLWTCDADGRPRAYLRWFGPGVRADEATIGRIATAASERGRGLGHALVIEGLARVATHHGAVPIRIIAQQYLERFYRGHGFARVTDTIVIDAIEHVEMVRPALPS